MADRDERRAARIDRLAWRLVAGRRLQLRPSHAGDRVAIMAAARLTGSREARPHMPEWQVPNPLPMAFAARSRASSRAAAMTPLTVTNYGDGVMPSANRAFTASCADANTTERAPVSPTAPDG
jgi:hypothetical protein